MSKPDETAGDWAKSVAADAADALAGYGLVPKDQFEQARDAIAEEIYVRLCTNSYPPAVDHSNADAAELLKLRRHPSPTTQENPDAGTRTGNERAILDYRTPPERPKRASSVGVRIVSAILAMPVTILALVFLALGARDAIDRGRWAGLIFALVIAALAVRAWVPVFRGLLRGKSPLG